MTTYIISGTVGRQPVQGEMRRFVVRSRVDGRVTNLLAGDTVKCALIKAGWVVNAVWSQIVATADASTDPSVWLVDSGHVTWGPTFCLTGATGNVYGASPAAGAKGYSADDYIRASFGGTFDGVFDVLIDVIDTNPVENPSPYWSQNNL